MSHPSKHRRLAVGDLVCVARADGTGQTETSEVFDVRGQFVFVQCANGILRCHQLDDLVPGEASTWLAGPQRNLRLTLVPDPPESYG